MNMIEEKKIEEAQEEIYEDRFLFNGEDIHFDNDDEEEMYYSGQIKEAIKLGANWALEQFLKDLWHPASEEPKMTNQGNEFVECLVKFKDGIVCLYNYDTWHHWWCCDEGNQKFLGLIDKWLYIDDLLTKEGGNK